MASGRGGQRYYRTSEQQGLRSLGREIPYSAAAGRPRSRAILRYVVVPFVVAVIVLAGVQWFRPVPVPAFTPAAADFVRLPGSPPTLPWPAEGSAAMAIQGIGPIGRSGTRSPVPISGLVKVMTAYVVLRDHPLAPGAFGPTIAVTQPVLAAAFEETAAHEAVVPVAAGESLSEFGALAGILVASGNDLALLLADWDSGSATAFVARMNAVARSLGLDHTRFVDPTGAGTGSVSTPGDLIRLGEAAMADPAFRAIVAMPQVTLPVAGVLYNLDDNLGQAGFVGLKTGADSASGGSYLFAATQVVAGEKVALYGAVLDQRYPDPTAAALYVGDLLAAAAFRAMAPLPLFVAGQTLGRLRAPWGPASPVVGAHPVSVVGIPGLSVPIRVRGGHLSRAVAQGTAVGVLRADTATGSTEVDLVTTRAIPGPTVLWHFTRL